MKGYKNRIERCCSLLALMLCCAVAFAATSTVHIKSVTGINKMFGDGMKMAAVALEYDCAISTSSLKPSCFALSTDKKITRVYANDDVALDQQGKGKNGRYVIIELSTDYQLPVPSIAFSDVKKHERWKREGKKLPRLEVKNVLKDVIAFRGNPAAHPSISLSSKHGGNGEDISVRQITDIMDTKGRVVPADSEWVDNVKNKNLVLDDFSKPDFMDPKRREITKFDIFLPYDYDASKKYPLVLYLEDEYSCANQHDAPLTEGLGAVIWSTPEEQSRQPAIVLVPVLKNNVADTAYHVNADFSAIPNLLDTIENLYHVDRSRVYLVGQSLGARAALALQERYPHGFAASLLVSGAWNPATASRLKDEHLLFVAADADSDTKAEVTAYIKQLKKAGAKASSKTVDMGQAHETVDGDISLLTENSANVKCLLMKAGTIVPKGIPDNALSNKTYTWRLVYQYASVRNWLFKQVLK